MFEKPKTILKEDDFKLAEVINNCNERCSKLECHERQVHFYNKIKVSTLENGHDLVFHGSRFETSTVYSPKYTYIDLIVFFGGVLGIWIGMSFMGGLSVMQELFQMFRRLKGKRKRKRHWFRIRSKK